MAGADCECVLFGELDQLIVVSIAAHKTRTRGFTEGNGIPIGREC